METLVEIGVEFHEPKEAWGMEGSGRLHIRLLGELQLTRVDAPPVALPASKKTRALLGYLVATGGPHRRERLCDFFWEGPSDPRAELRWSLSKIRPLLNDAQASRLIADRERVAFEARDAQIDLIAIRRCSGLVLQRHPSMC